LRVLRRYANVRGLLLATLAVAVFLVFALPFFAPTGHSWTQQRAPATTDVVDLYWLMFWIATVILVIVEGGIVASAILFRERPGHQAKTFHGHTLLEFSWTVIPAMIVIALSVASFRSLDVLSNTGDADMTIDVTGQQWTWVFRYPDDDLQVSQEVHIPTNTKVRFRLTSTDVLHSFWVPALSGKQDAVPGRDTFIWVMAPEEGRFLGQCAEFCGLAHADMLLTVVAEPEDRFREWIRTTKEFQAGAGGRLELGRQVAQQTCVSCHSFERGRQSTLRAAPNLFDYGSRGPLNAQVKALKNSGDPDWLKKWVSNAPAIKPGVAMPKWEGTLQPAQIEAVVEYLLSLKGS
jgi:cytochrome c oxidase subunit 2